MRRVIRGLEGAVLLALGLGFSAPAAAGPLYQPDGTPIPAGASLQNLFQALGEPLDAVDDAEVTPEIFMPSAACVFSLLARSGPYSSCLGWYNATGTEPALEEMHGFITCGDAVGTVKILDLSSDPAYYGGDFGLAQAVGTCASFADPASILDVGPEKLLMFTEPDYTPGGGDPQRFIHVVVYHSVLDHTKLYFALEDSLAGDNRFSDLVVSLSGLGLSGVPDATAPAAGLRVVPSILRSSGGSTEIVLDLPRAGPVSLEVFDLDGRRVRALLASTFLGAGGHRVSWDGRDALGRRAPAGLYFVQMRGEQLRLTGRVVIL
jgi:hypothetical protein